MPTWRMPSANRNRAGSGSRRASIEAKRLSTDFSFQPFARQQFVAVPAEPEDIRRGMQPTQFDELDQGLFSEAVDVERSAADEMLQPLDALRRADQPAGAADIDLALGRDRFAGAFGAVVGNS